MAEIGFTEVEFGSGVANLEVVHREKIEINAHIFWDIENMPPQAFIPVSLMPRLFDMFEASLFKMLDYIFPDKACLLNLTKVTAFGNESQVNIVGLDSRIEFENVPNYRRIYGAVMEAVISERECGRRARRPCIVIISSNGGYLEAFESLKKLNDHNASGVFVRAILCVVAKSRTNNFELFEAVDCAWSSNFFYGGQPWKPAFRYTSFEKVDSFLVPDERLPLLWQPLMGRCERHILRALHYLREELIRPDFVNIGCYLFYRCVAFQPNVTIVEVLREVNKYLEIVSLVEESTQVVKVFLDKYVDKYDEGSFVYVERGKLLYDFQDLYPYFDFAFDEDCYVKVVMKYVWSKIPVGTDLDRISRLDLAIGARDCLKKVLSGEDASVLGWLKVSHVLVMIEFWLNVGRVNSFGIPGYRHYISDAFSTFVSRKITDVRMRTLVFGEPLSSFFDVPDDQFMEV